jgi:hypothetical protein
MQDFVRFCNAKNDFFRRERASTRSRLLEVKSRVVQLIKQGGDKQALQSHYNMPIDIFQLRAKVVA